MDLNDVLNFVDDADRGAELELRHPVTTLPTGLKLTLAGPDSRIQRSAKLMMADEAAEIARADGTVSAEDRERAAIAQLARCVIRWEIVQDGDALPLNHANAVKLFTVPWVREQADLFAGNRANFTGVAP